MTTDAPAAVLRQRLSRTSRLALLMLVLLLFIGAVFCVGSPAYYSGKYAASAWHAVPTDLPADFEAEVQTEKHTCGLHSIRTIYRAYGINPEACNLRFRLGTDKRAHNFDPESLGTIHPDIVRVLRQDGFSTEVVNFPANDDAASIRAHLADGHPVLTLIRMTGLHWVVLAEAKANTARLYDSLNQNVEEVNVGAFVNSRVVGAILVRPQARA